MKSTLLFALFLFASGSIAADGDWLKPQTIKPLDPLIEYRYCGEPLRTASGSIFRDSRVYYAYRRQHPCPSTGLNFGACPDWSVDHIVPLAKGGCDAVVNMSWMPNRIKSCSDPACKDRWERKYYGDPFGVIDLSK